jgi:MoaA/NifB/PqqE/SkfB family radical SAM enzyme
VPPPSTHQRERVHILTGAVCNNNCVFCMEDDRERRCITNSATTDDTVRWILTESRGYEEVCFTSGEPTTNPRLAAWARLAKESGVERISLMTNGRMLSNERYAKALVAAGINRFYVSIHGHEPRLHEALTRTPGSFPQTLAGIDVIAGLKRQGIELHTSTVLTKRNLPYLGEIYDFVRARNVDQVVFNVMQANGRADTFFEQIFPAYTAVSAAAKVFLDARGQHEQPVAAFFVDIPLCTTEGLPDFNRGYVEGYVHHEPGNCGADPDGPMVSIRRADLDQAARCKRSECRACRYDGVCAGVWVNYVKRFGWDEFVPVPTDTRDD